MTNQTYKNIVVAGYPKSGNTWLTRLVAELVRCEAAGFWYDQPDICQEGKERTSSFKCYKSHDTYANLAADERIHRVIFVVRDPRDIVLSGGHYFPLCIPDVLLKANERGLIPRKGYNALVKLIHAAVGRNRMLQSMAQAVMKGSASLNPWLSLGWGDFVQPYSTGEHLIVRYEDMLENPHRECCRIVEYLGVPRSDREIESAIDAQSFARKKNVLKSEGKMENAGHMRYGKAQQWRHKLPFGIIAQINKELGDGLARFNYLLD